MKDTVALIVDPDFRARIQEVIARVRHTWVVATPANVAVAEQIWRASPNSRGLHMEGGVTRFIQYGDHNSHSCDPGYSILEVFGISLTNRLQSVLVELGFSAFTSMDYGLCARKLQPA